MMLSLGALLAVIWHDKKAAERYDKMSHGMTCFIRNFIRNFCFSSALRKWTSVNSINAWQFLGINSHL
jgi:hypothetical protein